MKKDKKWQQPDIKAVKRKDTNKVIASSRKGQVRYNTGIGPTPPVPPAYRDLA